MEDTSDLDDSTGANSPDRCKSTRPTDGSLNSDFGQPVSSVATAIEERPTAKQVYPLTNIYRSRRKRCLPRAAVPKSSENILKTQLLYSNTVQDRVLYRKEKMCCCLSSHLVRRWCTFEWFYSAIDYPWFAKREFEEYLNHVGLGHIPRLYLTRAEWGVIRSCLGKPRRFSEHFLCEEREKLNVYREKVRKEYAELRSGVKEGLPTDLATPLSVGQRVIVLHPKTREVHDGSVLTVDHDRCRVQFDRPEIGVEFVKDVDCMPSNPLDNMPEALKRRNITFEKFPLALSHLNGNLNFERPVMDVSSGHMEKEPSSINMSLQHGKLDSQREEIDNLERKRARVQLEVELHALEKETDKASKGRLVELDSQREEIDNLERKRVQLEVELHALEKEKDRASKARLVEVRKELDDLRDKLHQSMTKRRKGKA